MTLLKTGKIAPWVKRVLSQRGTRIELLIIIGLAFAYILIFQLLIHQINLFVSVFLTLPVVAAGFYFGRYAGVIAGLSGFALNVLLLSGLEGYTITQIVQYWPGYLVILGFGFFAGYSRDESFARKRIHGEVASRERFIALISIATRNILDTKKTEETSYRLVSYLTNLFVADYAYLIRWDAHNQQAYLIAATKPLDRPFSPASLEPEEASIVQAVIHSERPMVIEDVKSSKYIINPSFYRDLTLRTKTALVVPLITKDYCFGAVTLAFDTPRRFPPEEIVYVELASSQIALALRAIQQQLEIEAQLKEAKALANIERALSESEHIGVDEVLQLIVDSAKDLIPKAKNVILHLLDVEKQLLVPRAVVGYREKTKGRLNMRLGEGIAGMVMATGKVITISDVHTDHRFLNQTIPVKFRSLVVAPILSKEQCIGTISIHSDIPNAFDEGEVTLLETLGTQVAIGIDNAHLLETTRQNLLEIDILYRISQGLAASLDSDQLMKDVTGLLQQNFGYYHVMIYVVDPESGDLVARQGSGMGAARLVDEGYRLPLGEGIIGHVANTGQPFLTNDVDNVVFYVDHPYLDDVKSELTVPILIENKVIGILDIGQTSSRPLTQRQLSLSIAVADQLAAALQKANLYNHLQKSLTQEKAMRTKLIQGERLAVAGQLLASVSHELNNPLQAIQNALFLLKQDENLSTQGEQDLEIVLSEVERMANLLNRLRATYRPVHLEEVEEIHLNEIVEDIYSLTSTHMRHNEITFEFHPDPALPVFLGINDQVRRAVLNLFINAIEAMQTGGHLTVCTQSSLEDQRVILSIKDTGTGIDPKILPRIFEPFFTSKKTGTGLGLSITSDIIHQHKGEIQVENNQETGVTFNVWFPVEDSG